MTGFRRAAEDRSVQWIDVWPNGPAGDLPTVRVLFPARDHCFVTRRAGRRRCRPDLRHLRPDRPSGDHAEHRRRVSPLRLERLLVGAVAAEGTRPSGIRAHNALLLSALRDMPETGRAVLGRGATARMSRPANSRLPRLRSAVNLQDLMCWCRTVSSQGGSPTQTFSALARPRKGCRASVRRPTLATQPGALAVLAIRDSDRASEAPTGDGAVRRPAPRPAPGPSDPPPAGRARASPDSCEWRRKAPR